MRILWFSNAPWASTGYGTSTKVVTGRLQKLGHEVAISAYYGLEGGVLNLGGMPILPRFLDLYGREVMGAHYTYWRSDLLISNMDVWVTEPKSLPRSYHWAPWFPVDSEPLSDLIAARLRLATLPLVYSKWGLEIVREAGFEGRYVPFGVEVDVFKPSSKKEARRSVGLPEDAFVIGMVAANVGVPSRKAFQEQMDAFALLHKKHPDSLLYLHTLKAEEGERGGMALESYAKHLGIEEAVVFSDQFLTMLGFTEGQMATLYNSFDVLSQVTMGEGFGIPLIEAQACGTPVIAGDWTAMSELVFGGWKVPKEQADRWWLPLHAYYYRPRVEAIYQAYETAYASGELEELGERARRGSLELEADKVMREHWVPVLDELEAIVESERKAAGGTGNAG